MYEKKLPGPIRHKTTFPVTLSSQTIDNQEACLVKLKSHVESIKCPWKVQTGAINVQERETSKRRS